MLERYSLPLWANAPSEARPVALKTGAEHPDPLVEAALRSVGEGLGQGWILNDESGHIVMANHVAESTLGWNSSQLVGHYCRHRLRCLDANALDQRHPACRHGILARSGDLLHRTIHTADGSHLPATARGFQIFDDNGRLLGALCTFSTQQPDAPSDRTGAQFLSSLSHELRTPLSALISTIDFLSSNHSNMPKQDLSRILRMAHHSALLLHNLLENLLSASSAQLGCLKVQPHPSDLREALTRAISSIQPLLDRKQQRLIRHIPPTLPTLMLDTQRIMQVLINLLSNASKYAPQGDEITLSVLHRPRHLVVKVSEHGPGIPAHEQQYIFERFYRAKQRDPNGPAGVGLGLALVRSIVIAHGGKVGLKSRPGTGSTFWFTLPIPNSTNGQGELP